MDSELGDLLEESIRLELIVAELYLRFSDIYPDDRNFWWEMSLEEKNHAALLKSGRIYLDKGILPSEIVGQNYGELRKAVRSVEALLARLSRAPVPRAEAYHEALKTEASAAELHYQKLIEGEEGGSSKVARIFRSLGGDDRDHEKRIRGLMERRGLKPPENETQAG